MACQAQKALGAVLLEVALISLVVKGFDQQSVYAGMQDAVDLLQPLLTDTVDYVKQGALIATALVLMQQPESKVTGLHVLICPMQLFAYHMSICWTCLLVTLCGTLCNMAPLLMY